MANLAKECRNTLSNSAVRAQERFYGAACRKRNCMSLGRILVIDQDPKIRRLMRSTLTALGYLIADARTAEDALQKLREERFDLVLLDLPPGLKEGFEICRSVRSRSEIHLIALGVEGDVADKISALDAGADDYITKPFSMPELVARIRAVLRRSPVSPEAASRITRLDGLEINFGARRVLVAGVEVHLTPKEFALLSYLVANANVSLTHRQILQAVWGPDYGEEVEYLRVFVKQLRKKLELDPAHPRYILTEPWLGYRFAMPSAGSMLHSLSGERAG